MTQEYYTLVTDIGIAKFTNAQITQKAVNLTQIAVGDGNGSIYNPTQAQTALKNERWRGQVSAVEVDAENENYVNIETTIPGTVGGWMIREAAVFDDEGDLILISKQPETFKPTFSQGSVKDMIIKLVMELSNTDVAAIKIDPTIIIASRAYVNEKVEQVNRQVEKIEQKVIQAEQKVEQIKEDVALKTEVNALATNKVDKVNGKQLSANDYTNADKSLVAQIPQKANLSDVAKIADGTPLFALDTEGMVDTNRLYVNVTNGFIYMHSNGDWTNTTVQYQAAGGDWIDAMTEENEEWIL